MAITIGQDSSILPPGRPSRRRVCQLLRLSILYLSTRYDAFLHLQVPERENTTSIVVTTAGIVLGIVILGAVVGVVVIKHIRTNRDGIKVDSLDEQVYTASASSRRSSFTTSEDEVDLTEADFEDELVEDQYLPSDSELKSGLELMFLKQQRHYWTRKKKP